MSNLGDGEEREGILDFLKKFYSHGINASLHEIIIRLRSNIRKVFYKAAGIGFVRSDYGVLMRSNWGDATFEFCVNASYGSFYSDYLVEIDFPFVFVDIGSNQGLYSLIASTNNNCMRAIAFEPVKSNFELLVENIAANNYSDRIVPINSAISSNFGPSEINVKEGHSGAASLSQAFDSNSSCLEEIQLLNSGELDKLIPKKVNLIIKIDVEGHEEVVIRELMKCEVLDQIRSIFYEVDEDWCQPIEITSLLRGADFSKFTTIGSGTHYDVLACKSLASI